MCRGIAASIPFLLLVHRNFVPIERSFFVAELSGLLIDVLRQLSEVLSLGPDGGRRSIGDGSGTLDLLRASMLSLEPRKFLESS